MHNCQKGMFRVESNSSPPVLLLLLLLSIPSRLTVPPNHNQPYQSITSLAVRVAGNFVVVVVAVAAAAADVVKTLMPYYHTVNAKC